MLDPMALIKKKVQSAAEQSEVTYCCRMMQRRFAGSRTLRLDDRFKAAGFMQPIRFVVDGSYEFIPIREYLAWQQASTVPALDVGMQGLALQSA